MRLKCHGVLNRYERASELSQDRYVKSLLPVPHLVHSADELFGCDGTETFDKVWPLEVLDRYMQASGTRGDVAIEIDITCLTCLAEKFISQLLPEAVPCPALEDAADLHSPLQACEWFEDMDRSNLVVAKEIEPYLQDMPEAWQFPDGLNKDILESYSHVTKEFEWLERDATSKPQIQYVIDPEPYANPLLCRKESGKELSALQILDGAGSESCQAEPVHQIRFKPFEIGVPDDNSSVEDSIQVLRYKELEKYASNIFPNHTEFLHESDVWEPIKLLDVDPAAFLVDRLLLELKIEHQELHPASSRTVVADCSSLLDNVSAISNVKGNTTGRMTDQVQHMIELPELIEEANLRNVAILDHRAYVIGLIKPSPIEHEDFDSQKTASQEFEGLVVLPELTLDASHFHLLPVPSFTQEQRPCVAEGVFKALFREKASLPTPTTASDWLYLDWHLSQVGHCNIYGCFHLQKRIYESEFLLTHTNDIILEKKLSDLHLLLSVAEDFLLWRIASTDLGFGTKEECPATDGHISLPTSKFDPSHILQSGANGRHHSDQSILTDKQEKDNMSAMFQDSNAVSHPTSMDSVLTLMKQARQGDFSFEAKMMQSSKHGAHEGDQGLYNSEDKYSEVFKGIQRIMETTSASRHSIPIPSFCLEDTSINRLSRNTTYIGPNFQIVSPTCPSNGSPQNKTFKVAPPPPPAFEELKPQHSQVEDIRVSSEHGPGHGPHVIVVANILQPNGPILSQRRSTYQKILGLENEDLQVVERELNLPVDLILNPSTCLTIYTREKLQFSDVCSLASKEFLSCIMDTLVDCHMKALSYSFQRWFVIFEGESAFHSAILHIMEYLYTSAAGFEIRVQSFMSNSLTDTDYLVLRCIKSIWKMSKGTFESPMSEDLTDGEAFLAKFPSLNPLASHAILGLNVPIATFISWSHEEQTAALQGFNVRTESLKLLKAQCLFGKVETARPPEKFGPHSWPSASDVVPPEVVRHNLDGISYFPPASEVTGVCERDLDDVPARGEPSYQNPLSRPASPQVQHSSVQHCNFSWDKSYWPSEWGQSLPQMTSHLQRPNRLREELAKPNQGPVHSFLEEWIQKRKTDMKNSLASGPDLFGESFQIPKRDTFSLKTRVDPFPTSAEFTEEGVGPRRENGTSFHELRWGPLSKTPPRRCPSALDQFRYKKRRVCPALPPQLKKLKPPIPPRRSTENEFLSQLDNALKISRQTCYKISSPSTARFEKLFIDHHLFSGVDIILSW